MAYKTLDISGATTLTNLTFMAKRYPWLMRDVVQIHVYKDFLHGGNVLMLSVVPGTSERLIRYLDDRELKSKLEAWNDELRPKRGRAASKLHTRGEL
jgi:hypothetical protein